MKTFFTIVAVLTAISFNLNAVSSNFLNSSEIIKNEQTTVIDYTSDIEFNKFISPTSFKAETGIFSDAMHIMTESPITIKVRFRNNGSLPQVGAKIYLTITEIDINDEIRYYDSIKIDILVYEEREIEFEIPNSIIKTYSDLIGEGLNPEIPERFKPTMISNVTPRYKIKVEVQSDENNENNSGEEVYRFFIKQSNELSYIISSEFANADIYDLEGKARSEDEIAGKLNYEALKDGFEQIGWFPSIDEDIDHPGDQLDSFKIDVFDRLAWEPRAVDYTLWDYLLWTDRDDRDSSGNLNQITKTQQEDITNYLAVANQSIYKCIAISGQEIIRNLDFEPSSENYDSVSTKFAREYFRALNSGDGYAFGKETNCDSKHIEGLSIARELVYTIKETGSSFDYGGVVVNDPYPQLGVVENYQEGEGLSRASFLYMENEGHIENSNNAGMTVTKLFKGLAYIAVDWRHFEDSEYMLRGILDYFDRFYWPPHSVEEKSHEIGISIFPNPATDYIEIYLNNVETGLRPVSEEIEIFNVLGQPVLRNTLSSVRESTPLSEVSYRLDVSQLHPGVYFMRFGEEFLKFVKI